MNVVDANGEFLTVPVGTFRSKGRLKNRKANMKEFVRLATTFFSASGGERRSRNEDEFLPLFVSPEVPTGLGQMGCANWAEWN